MVSKKPIRNVSEKNIFGREEREKDLWSTFKVVFKKTGKGIVIIEEDMTLSVASAEFEERSGYPKGHPEEKKNKDGICAR